MGERPIPAVARRVNGYAATRNGRLEERTISRWKESAIARACVEELLGRQVREGRPDAAVPRWEELRGDGWRLVRVQVLVYRGEVPVGRRRTAGDT